MSLLGNRLRQARKKKGFTQDYVAKIIGSTYQTISNYERGERDPDTETLAGLANLYEVSLDYLAGRTNDPTPPKKRDKPNYEEYVLAASTLPDGLRRISDVITKYRIDHSESVRLSNIILEKFKDSSVVTVEEIANIDSKIQDDNKDDANGEDKH